MKIYLVGGAVRDKLLGQQPLDNDWVVVGATAAKMLTLGFQQVGKDFPVFLHPTTKEEYALARTERKSGHGYTAFTCIADPTVTLEQDLLRRDLTINAMAMDVDGNLYDPYNGKEDLTKRILRHVSPSFIEDPLRVLRVARFAAKLAPHDFVIAPETMTLLQQMVAAKELAYLTPDRVWQEVVKSCSYERPEVFLQVLQQVGALAIMFPEWSKLLAAPIDSNEQQLGELGITNLQMAATQTDNLEVRLAILLVSASISAQNNTKLQQQMILAICQRYPISNAVKDLALLVVNQRANVPNINELSATQILTVLEQLDAFRRADRLAVIVLAISIITNTSHEILLKKWQECLQICQSVAVQDIIAAGFVHAEISAQLRNQRIVKLQEMQQ